MLKMKKTVLRIESYPIFVSINKCIIENTLKIQELRTQLNISV
jgi:hypothetical protein